MPFDDVRGVSRKAEDEERQAIKERLAKLELPEGCGVIVRTNALDQPQKTLNRDLNALLRLWKKIREEADAGKGPRLLYSDQDLIVQALRDSVDSSIAEILVDDDAAFAKAQGYMRTFMPRSGNRLVRYTDRHAAVQQVSSSRSRSTASTSARSSCRPADRSSSTAPRP